MTQTQLKEIAERAAKATPGPWKWHKCYEMGSGERHWSLKNPQNAIEGRVLDLAFISLDSWSTRQKWYENPNVALIERARTDIPDLLAHIHTLEDALTKMVEFGERQGWKHVYIDAARAALAPPAPATREIK